MPSKEVLSLRGVTKHFGGLCALNDVSLDVYEGEVLGLIGPNGSGKTTVFNLISGIYRPTSGTILYEGRHITGDGADRICHRGIGRTFQIVKPFAGITVLENVMIGALFGNSRRVGLSEARRKASEIIELVGLQEKTDVQPSALTLAQKKRLELARALATGPRLLLLDEVAAGLNPSDINELVTLVKRISDCGVTIIWVEHVLRALLALAHRVVALSYGEKIAEGPPPEVMQDAGVVQSYLGKVEGIATGGGNHRWLR